jgi:hypothetical protein
MAANAPVEESEDMSAGKATGTFLDPYFFVSFMPYSSCLTADDIHIQE